MAVETGTETSRRFGPPPQPPRDGDKIQARQRINVEVRTGHRPHPNTIHCKDCGHVWKRGERRHEYDHHLGYAAEHHYDVESVCTTCHAKRDSDKKNKTECLRGHPYTIENTIMKNNLTRQCRECARIKDRNRPRRSAAYWRSCRARRKKESTR